MLGMSESGRAAWMSADRRTRLGSLAGIAIFDIAGPLVAYSQLHAHGFSEVSALILSGVFPAFGVLLTVVRHRRLDAVGALVLLGIAVGTVLGLVSGSARLVLIEGSVPTGIFGVVCLASLWSRRPLIYRFAVEFIGPDSHQGREFAENWQYQGFRHVFRVMTIVWGVAYLLEAAARVVIIEVTSAGTALAISKIMPYVVAGLLVAWMIMYGRAARRRGERLAAAHEAAEPAGQAAAEPAGQAAAEPAGQAAAPPPGSAAAEAAAQAPEQAAPPAAGPK
jgi:hypothetical protein